MVAYAKLRNVENYLAKRILVILVHSTMRVLVQERCTSKDVGGVLDTLDNPH